MLFCPDCHTILYLNESEVLATELPSFECSLCGYSYPITKTIIQTNEYKELKKEIPKESELGDNTEELAAKIIAICPACNNNEAYFQSIQIRSADESTTNFYKCTKCKKRWKE